MEVGAVWWRAFRSKYARDLTLGAALALTTLGFILFILYIILYFCF